MLSKILSPTYTFDAEQRLWARSDYAGIGYSDGDHVEARIAAIINNAHDLTVLSAELAAHCTDWPSLYHLSRRRANLLRPLENDLQKVSVLEVGAGCGAITRYLGEIGAEVLALEGSRDRASIAASRCRGLKNVVVVAEAFHLFQSVTRFDVVTLIGVLEYARKFFPATAGDPVDAMLAHVKRFLKPGGKLIIAIENQLGLKYFAGFPEDHTGKLMFGIEEHYNEESVATWGKRELGKRVSKAGLGVHQWWYPFPDYKLPSLVVSEAGAIPQDDIDLSPVVQGACIADPQYPPSISFHQERVWRPVIFNGLLGDMANSFMLVASDTMFSHEFDLPLAVHYATERMPEFAKKVVFKRTRDGSIMTHHSKICPSAYPEKNSLVAQQLNDQPYIKGKLWQDRLVEIVTSPSWTEEWLQEWMKVWFDTFCTFAGINEDQNLIDKKISGKYFDAIPRNMLVDEKGVGVFIDQEWIYLKDISVGYVAFRALIASLSPIKLASKPLDDKDLLVLPLSLRILKSINLVLNEEKIRNYLYMEGQLDHFVTGKKAYSAGELLSWLESLELQVSDTQTSMREKLAREEKQLLLTTRILAEREEQLAIMNQALAQRQQQLAITSQTLVERDKQLKDVLNSRSWQITSPIRKVGKWLKSI